MLRTPLLLVLLVALPALAQDGLPGFIPLKTTSQTFDNHHDFALKDGHVWFRPRRFRLEDPVARWMLLGKTGLPFLATGATHEDPSRLVEISADATGLVAIAEDNRLFDGELDDKGVVRWYYAWGFPWRMLPAPVYLPPASERLAWVYSLLNQEGFYSEDIDGNPHTVIRIDTVYVLSPDGRSIRFNDPWLPSNHFDFQIAGPRQGTVPAVTLSASGSTLFVMDRAGNFYTRLVDFDTLGGNPGITYSYKRQRLPTEPEDEGAYWRGLLPMIFDVRSLPAEGWRAQPPIPGRFTSRLTVLQNGKGNAARELRVEGSDAEGHSGYWSKPVLGKQWSFVPVGQPITGSWVEAGTPAEEAKPLGEDLSGTARIYPPHEGTPVDLRAELRGFNTSFDPAVLRLYPEGGSEPLELTFHIRPDVAPITNQGPKRVLGGLLVPMKTPGEDATLDQVRALLGEPLFQEIFVVISKDEVEVSADPHSRADDCGYRMRFRRTY